MDKGRNAIAIIGMAGRFPGAGDVRALWENLRAGVESIRFFTDEELEAAEYDYEAVRHDPGFVKARGFLDDVDLFDAAFFGFRPREAASLDPQQRLWFECAWEALEDAGVAPSKFSGSIGVFAGGGYLDSYLLHNVCADRDFIERLVRLRDPDSFQNVINNDKDFLPTRTSYLFNLDGPSINVQTACSTSLVAVAQAAQALVVGDADICIAGGVAIQLPQIRGYLAQDGGMDSPDGHVRAFDARANGTVFGNGLGAVVLKRWADAQRDGDNVLAVMHGFSVNNDGSTKASYIAPSVEGQAGVIRRALEMAGFGAETIGYVEAHGTGTSVGDPIEVEALTRAFRATTDEKQFCAIGSIKSNIGHLDSAAGVAGLIKAVGALRAREIPPTINYATPNPRIDFDDSPFFVADELRPWTASETPRRAGVSSFGVGGTNVHVVLEEAPAEAPRPCSEEAWLIPLSARSSDALEARTNDLVEALEASENFSLADVSYSLLRGREDMEQRRFTVASTCSEASELLGGGRSPRVVTRPAATPVESVVFMFPGQGAQHIGMGEALYRSEPVFRDAIDRCREILATHLDLDVLDLIYPGGDVDRARAEQRLTETRYAQPALFAVEYALASLWRAWGVRPTAMIGHSLGEFTAACIAGVMSLEDTLKLLVLRGRLMHEQDPGGMLAVRTPAAELEPLLPEGTALAAANAPALSVASGPLELIDELAQRCADRDLETRALHTSHAFHSAMMEPALQPFHDAVNDVDLSAPAVPFISCCTGTWITDAEATDPAYWARQMRQPVLFRRGVEALRDQGDVAFLEVGPGTTLGSFARQCGKPGSTPVVSSLGHPKDERSARSQIMEALGHLWLMDAGIAWDAVFAGHDAHKVVLPTYPFQRKRYWIDPPASGPQNLATTSEPLPAAAPAPPDSAIPPVMEAPAVSTSPVDSSRDRKPRIRQELLDMLVDLSGEDFDAEQQSFTFMEMGFDSLFLTQVSSEIQNKFGIKLRFRRMLEDLSTLDALADFFNENLPAEMFAAPEPAPVPASTPAPGVAVDYGGAAAPASDQPALHAFLHEQMALIQRHLQGVAPVASAPSAPVAGAAGAAAPVQVVELPEAAADARPKAFGAQARIETEDDDEMSPPQRAAYDDFVDRYTRKTAASKEFTEKHRKGMADPRAVTGFRPTWKELVYPIVVDRSKGAKLWDLDGNEYVDLTCGFGSNFLGNQPDFIAEALHRQIDLGYEVGPQHPLTADVADLIRELTGMERVAFCNTGSEAVMGALRQARTITGRSLVAIFANSYHGIFDEVIVRGTKKLRSIAAAPGILASAVENVLVLEYDSPESLEILRQRGPELAAIMAEPVQSRNPKLQPREFLHELREIADQNGAALIFDEVITGFRISPGGAQEYFGVRADLATYGKIIGGGLPFAAIAGNDKFMDALDGGHWEFGDDSYPEVGVTYFAGTFVRHPLALAAAKASLEHLKAEGPQLQRTLNERTAAFAGELNDFFAEHGAPINIDTFGSLCRITVSEEEEFGPLFYYWLRDKGVHIWEGFGCFLTTAHTDDEVRLVVDAFKDSVRALQAAELMTRRPAAAPEAVQTEALPAGGFPLTEAQREIWHACQMGDRASCAYNESFTLELDGALDVDRFREAVDFVSQRHEALRIRFADNGEYQYTVPPEAPPLPLIDWTGRDANQEAEGWRQVLDRHATEPFDLVAGPLIRNELYELGPERHVFVSTAHHIVFDGWSAGVYIDEIGAAYTALAEGRDIDLPDAPSFSDYVRNEQETLSSDEGVRASDYWREVFATRVDPLELPTDRPHPRSKTYEGASVHWEFSDAVYETARRAAAAQNTTLYSFLLAAYGAFLHRVTGQEDLVVGIPAAGQAMGGEYGLIGHCVNILPLRARPASTMPFSEFLRATSGELIEAQDHQPATFGSILRLANVSRSPGRSPLVEVIFNLNRKLPNDSLPGVESKISEVEKKAINWDLFLNCSEEDGKLTTDCDYNTDVFDATTVSRWLAMFEQMLLSIADRPDALLQELDLVSDEERAGTERLLSGPEQEPAAASLPELVRDAARRQPDRTATAWGDESTSYAELVALANRTAHYLTSKGVEAGDGVGVALGRSPLLPAILLGIHGAGAFYVPLDPTYPRARLQAVIDDAGLTTFITDSQSSRVLDGAPGERIVFDEEIDEINDRPSDDTALPAAEDLAYVIYTSGSTGEPKGVEISHRALVNFLTAMRERPGIGPEDVLLAVTTLSFDIAGLELFLPLTAGAQVVVAPDELSEDAGALGEAIDTHDITVMQATPTHWRLLFDGGWQGKASLRALVGGERLPTDVAGRLLDACGEVWNMYGPTETTIWSTCHLVSEEDLDGAVPIGLPIDNTSVFILDRNGAPAPIGVPGELYIGGAGLARGYFGRPELTAERFVDTGIGGNGSVRLYRTGDLCRWTAAKTLECIGRLDDQVKIRGHRVELGAVEAKLGAHEHVGSAVASRWEPHGGDVRLVAHVTPRDGASPDIGELRDYLRDELPEFMVPQHLVVVPELPRTPNGKIDRRALPDPREAGGSVDIVEPTNPIEATIRDVWVDALGVAAFGTEDNFFDLGGHSIVATRVVTALQQQLEPALTLRQLFENPTVSGIARQVEALQALRGDGKSPSPTGKGREELVF